MVDESVLSLICVLIFPFWFDFFVAFLHVNLCDPCVQLFLTAPLALQLVLAYILPLLKSL